MLHQLESGDWIDLREVIGVIAIGATIGIVSGNLILPKTRIQLNHGMHEYRIVEFNTIEGARQYRDDIARLVNNAQKQ